MNFWRLTRNALAYARRESQKRGFILRRFRLVNGLVAEQSREWMAADVRYENEWISVWLPIGDREVQEALDHSHLTRLIGGRVVAFGGSIARKMAAELEKR